jgi:hypothetical protein
VSHPSLQKIFSIARYVNNLPSEHLHSRDDMLERRISGGGGGGPPSAGFLLSRDRSSSLAAPGVEQPTPLASVLRHLATSRSGKERGEQ